MPQYSYDQPIAVLGQLATYDMPRIDSLTNPLLAQIQTVTVVTFVDGLYRITIQGNEGTFQIDYTAAGAVSAAVIADGLEAEAATMDELLNIVSVVSDGVDTVTLTFLHPGFFYNVSVSSPGSDMVTATAQAAGGINFPLGVGITSDDGRLGRLPTTGDTALDLWGVTVRNPDYLQPFVPVPAGPNEETFLPASALSVLREGEVWVASEVAVAVNDPVFIRVTATGTEQAGALRNDADGGDAVQVPGRWKTATTAPGQLARIVLNIP